MKKIFMLAAVVGALVACDPVSEDITNGGHITDAELLAKSSVTLNGNVVSCTTSAPVNAKWSIAGKELVGNYAWKKLKLGDQTIVLTGLCADGTEVTANFPISVTTITDPLEKFYIYEGPSFSPAAWDAADMRFSDNEGKHLPYLSDDVYWGFKTLIFDITDASADCVVRVMNGWWANTYIEAESLKNGLWELQLTEDIAKTCARGGGGEGKDLDLMLTSGSCTINTIYYEE